MKGNTFIIILILVVLAAVVTEPDRKDFEKWLAKKENSAGWPLIKHNNNFGFSLFDVEYHGKQKRLTRDTSNQWAPGVVKKERYLGLFGTFWKL